MILNFNFGTFKNSPIPLGLFMFFLVFPVEFNNYSLMFLIAWWLVTKQFYNIKNIYKRKQLLLFITYYFVVLMGLLYTRDYDTSKSISSVTFSFLAFPFLIGTLDINNKNLKTILLFFIVGVFTYTFLLILNATKNVVSANSFYFLDPLHPTWKYYYFQYTRLSPFLSPIYLSVYTTIAILGSLSLIKEFKKQKYFLIFIILFLLLFTFLLSSRIGLISLLASCSIYLATSGSIKQLFLVRRKIAFSLILTITIVLTLFNNGFESRLTKTLPFFITDWNTVAQINNSSGKRAQLYMISIKIIESNYPVGLGSGASELAISEYYYKYFEKDFPFFVKGMNCHNQYLESTVSWGIGGLLLTMSLLIFNMRLFVKGRNWYGVSIIVCLGITMLGETILVTQKGVFIFVTILMALIANEFTNKETKNL